MQKRAFLPPHKIVVANVCSKNCQQSDLDLAFILQFFCGVYLLTGLSQETINNAEENISLEDIFTVRRRGPTSVKAA